VKSHVILRWTGLEFLYLHRWYRPVRLLLRSERTLVHTIEPFNQSEDPELIRFFIKKIELQ
jgi:hypothetical protein